MRLLFVFAVILAAAVGCDKKASNPTSETPPLATNQNPTDTSKHAENKKAADELGPDALKGVVRDKLVAMDRQSNEIKAQIAEMEKYPADSGVNRKLADGLIVKYTELVTICDDVQAAIARFEKAGGQWPDSKKIIKDLTSRRSRANYYIESLNQLRRSQGK